MNLITASVVILLIAILCVPIATRLRLPLEVFLFIGSCIIGFTPHLPVVHIDPNVVFNVFLPPILFSAAYFTSWRDFKAQLRPIGQLAIGLVIFTTIFVAVAVKIVLPFFSWPEAFLLGAIVSPTDAPAATSVLRRFKVPRRFITIVEGESLINDATALTLYRFCLAAILYHSFSFPKMIGMLFVLSIGGFVVGIVTAFCALRLLNYIKHTYAETTFTFIVAFSSYLLAERLGFSGVIATVVAGIYFGIELPQFGYSATRINAKATWGTVLFVINGFVFALIGFELPLILNMLEGYSAATLIYYGVMLTIVVMLLRLIWIYPSAYIPRALFPSIAKKDPMPSMGMLFALGWCGMRGIISLAAALAIPREVSINMPASHLDLLIFLVYFIVAATLIFPALTLPAILRGLHITNGDEAETKMKQEAMARIKAGNEAIAAVKELAKTRHIPQETLEHFLSHLKHKTQIIETNLKPTPFSMISDDFQVQKLLTLAALKAERDALLQLRRSGEIHDEIFWNLSDELDLEDLRASSLRI